MSAKRASEIRAMLRDRILATPLTATVGDETAWREQPTLDTTSQSFLWAHATFAIVPGDVRYQDRSRGSCRASLDLGVVLLMHARPMDPDHLQDLDRALDAAESIRGALAADIDDVEFHVPSIGLTDYDPERGLFVLGVSVTATYEARS